MITPWRWDRRARRLARHLPRTAAAATLGDLLEEFEAHRARAGRWRAEWWLMKEMSSLSRAYRRSQAPPSSPRAWLMRRSEFRQTVRSLTRAPWYALTLIGVVALTMALGATVFAVVDGALFKPLPYPDGSRLFTTWVGWSQVPGSLQPGLMSDAQVHDWRTSVGDARLTAFSAGSLATLGEHDSVMSAQVDAAFFDVVGLWPALGGFAAEDFQAAAAVRPAIITDDFWAARFGRDPGVIGRVLMDGTRHGVRIAGVLAPNFVFPWDGPPKRLPQILLPRVDASPRSLANSLFVLVRLSASASPARVAAEISAASARWAAAHPAPPRPNLSSAQAIRRSPYDRAALEPIRDVMMTESLSSKAWVVFGLAGSLMLLACLNVASLTIARLRDRWRDLAVRRALGARYADLARLLAIENAVVVVFGTAVGVAGAHATLAVTLRFLGGSALTVLKAPAIDARALVFAALAAAACFGVVTALAARAAVGAAVRAAVAEGGATTRRARGRLSLVTIEVALALIVAVAGALVATSLVRAYDEDPGFDVANAALVAMSPPPRASSAEIEELVARMGRLQGVAHVGATAHAVLERTFSGSAFDAPPGYVQHPPGSGDLPIESVAVTHGYLRAAGFVPHDGRLPTDAEYLSGAPLIVVSDTVAREYWPGQEALGQSLLYTGRPFTVVGVVPDARYMSLDMEPQGEIYYPAAVMPQPSFDDVLVRFDVAARAPLGPFVTDVARLCPTCWFRSAEMLTDALSTTIQPRQFSAWLFSAFGVSALLIVGVGVLGLMAMTTNRRTREIGIRMALGATASAVVGQMLREQLRSVFVGLAMGGLAAAWLVRFAAAYLYKTRLDDPWSWSAALGALLVVAVVAALIPSRRASLVDPVQALRID